MSDNIGVERIFPINSPFIDSIVVNSEGKVRRTKLYYLRSRRGKAARIKKNYINTKQLEEINAPNYSGFFYALYRA